MSAVAPEHWHWPETWALATLLVIEEQTPKMTQDTFGPHGPKQCQSSLLPQLNNARTKLPSSTYINIPEYRDTL